MYERANAWIWVGREGGRERETGGGGEREREGGKDAWKWVVRKESAEPRVE